MLATLSLEVKHFNPRSPWGERLFRPEPDHLEALISIHAPRGGSDHDKGIPPVFGYQISIHAPRGGSDRNPLQRSDVYGQFQSTLPVGGATQQASQPNNPNLYFNPRSPWGERLEVVVDMAGLLKFQSTLPVGGATVLWGLSPPHPLISIHAPRGGSDYIQQ